MNEAEQWAFFYEIFDGSLKRLAPGSDEATQRALAMVLPEAKSTAQAAGGRPMRMLDVGCGNGAQTLALARQTAGTIVALDNHQPYLDELSRRAQAAGLADRIEPCLCDMHDLARQKGPFDLIWSEGALYIVGFEKGLTMCRSLQGTSGTLGASELCWLKADVPAQCQQYFAREYPAMNNIAAALKAVTAAGYELVGHFVLPESAWWQGYYAPLEKRLTRCRQACAGESDKLQVIAAMQEEIDIYRRYSDCYGYVFYLMRCA